MTRKKAIYATVINVAINVITNKEREVRQISDDKKIDSIDPARNALSVITLSTIRHADISTCPLSHVLFATLDHRGDSGAGKSPMILYI